MKTMRFIYTAVFGLMTAALIAAGFYNPVHFLFGVMSAVLTVLSILMGKSDENVGEVQGND